MNCPLCNRQLNQTEEGVLPPTFRCPTQTILPGKSPEPHYIKYSTGGWTTGMYYLEQAILLPYRIQCHHLNDRVLTRIHKDGTEEKRVLPTYSTLDKLIENPKFGSLDRRSHIFQQIVKLPMIHLLEEDRMRDKIKTLLLFL